MKQCCATESYYVQEAGEALVQALLDQIAEAESEGQQRELCSKALAVLEELEEKLETKLETKLRRAATDRG